MLQFTLFNDSFKFGIIPKAGNIAVYLIFFFRKQLSDTPLYMKGAKIKVESYRPFSPELLLSVNLRED